MDDKE